MPKVRQESRKPSEPTRPNSFKAVPRAHISARAQGMRAQATLTAIPHALAEQDQATLKAIPFERARSLAMSGLSCPS